jgi:hypothetical protein
VGVREDEVVGIAGYNKKHNPRTDGKTEMSTISLRLPDSLHERTRELAKKDRVSTYQFTASALA